MEKLEWKNDMKEIYYDCNSQIVIKLLHHAYDATCYKGVQTSLHVIYWAVKVDLTPF